MIFNNNKSTVKYRNFVFRLIINIFISIIITACSSSRAIIDLSPKYRPEKLVVPKDWKGNSPFKLAEPADNTYNGRWWKIFGDETLNAFEDMLEKNNPNLQAAAERFVQARYEMMKARSAYLPHVGVTDYYFKNQRSPDDLFFGQITEFTPGNTSSFLSFASWEPDIWSRLRNTTTARVMQAQALAADYGAIRLMLSAELAANYFILRGLDAKNFVYHQSIEYYKKSLNLIMIQFNGNLASRLDVARAKFLLATTEARQLDVVAQRQVVEQSIAALLNISPSAFKIKPNNVFKVPNIIIPNILPGQLLERRPDIASLERQMATANKGVGISRAAFFPNLNLGGSNSIFYLANIKDIAWALGSVVDLNLFVAGFRRAQVKKSWSIYRETLNQYRAGVLNAYREVENGLARTNYYNKELGKQNEAVDAAFLMQDLTDDLFKGRLSSSLDLLYAQINTLEARIKAVEVKIKLLTSAVFLVKALGGGWDRCKLPKDSEIQPFNTLQYFGLDNIKPAGNIDKSAPENHMNLLVGDNEKIN